MRIIGGMWRKKKLVSPLSWKIRPTSDRVRENLFNILEHRYPDKIHDGRGIDLFAGTGAIGLEALSRGMNSIVFVEKSIEGVRLLYENIKLLSVQNRTKVLSCDVKNLILDEAFDLIFIDPPYQKGLSDLTLTFIDKGGWIKDNGICIVEEDKYKTLKLPSHFTVEDTRIYGKTALHFIRVSK